VREILTRQKIINRES